MDKNIIYTNSFGVAISPVDCCITFKTSFPHQSDNEEIANSTKVIMTLQYVKLLAESLQNQIEKYENKYGPISELSIKALTAHDNDSVQSNSLEVLENE